MISYSLTATQYTHRAPLNGRYVNWILIEIQNIRCMAFLCLYIMYMTDIAFHTDVIIIYLFWIFPNSSVSCSYCLWVSACACVVNVASVKIESMCVSYEIIQYPFFKHSLNTFYVDFWDGWNFWSKWYD